jgi:hypothetical protein
MAVQNTVLIAVTALVGLTVANDDPKPALDPYLLAALLHGQGLEASVPTGFQSRDTPVPIPLCNRFRLSKKEGAVLRPLRSNSADLQFTVSDKGLAGRA